MEKQSKSSVPPIEQGQETHEEVLDYESGDGEMLALRQQVTNYNEEADRILKQAEDESRHQKKQRNVENARDEIDELLGRIDQSYQGDDSDWVELNKFSDDSDKNKSGEENQGSGEGKQDSTEDEDDGEKEEEQQSDDSVSPKKPSRLNRPLNAVESKMLLNPEMRAYINQEARRRRQSVENQLHPDFDPDSVAQYQEIIDQWADDRAAEVEMQLRGEYAEFSAARKNLEELKESWENKEEKRRQAERKNKKRAEQPRADDEPSEINQPNPEPEPEPNDEKIKKLESEIANLQAEYQDSPTNLGQGAWEDRKAEINQQIKQLGQQIKQLESGAVPLNPESSKSKLFLADRFNKWRIKRAMKNQSAYEKAKKGQMRSQFKESFIDKVGVSEFLDGVIENGRLEDLRPQRGSSENMDKILARMSVDDMYKQLVDRQHYRALTMLLPDLEKRGAQIDKKEMVNQMIEGGYPPMGIYNGLSEFGLEPGSAEASYILDKIKQAGYDFQPMIDQRDKGSVVSRSERFVLRHQQVLRGRSEKGRDKELDPEAEQRAQAEDERFLNYVFTRTISDLTPQSMREYYTELTLDENKLSKEEKAKHLAIWQKLYDRHQDGALKGFSVDQLHEQTDEVVGYGEISPETSFYTEGLSLIAELAASNQDQKIGKDLEVIINSLFSASEMLEKQAAAPNTEDPKVAAAARGARQQKALARHLQSLRTSIEELNS